MLTIAVSFWQQHDHEQSNAIAKTHSNTDGCHYAHVTLHRRRTQVLKILANNSWCSKIVSTVENI